MKVPEELFEIIDERGKVLGLAPRSEFHDVQRKKKLLHKAVHCIAIDLKTGKTWVQKRSLKKDLYGGLWELGACGHAMPGETPEQTALREVGEELNLNPSILFPLGKRLFENAFERELQYVFWFKAKEMPRKSAEASELKLVSPAELQKMIFKGEVTDYSQKDFQLAEKKKLF